LSGFPEIKEEQPPYFLTETITEFKEVLHEISDHTFLKIKYKIRRAEAKYLFKHFSSFFSLTLNKVRENKE
jgi:hypothetical protein